MKHPIWHFGILNYIYIKIDKTQFDVVCILVLKNPILILFLFIDTASV